MSNSVDPATAEKLAQLTEVYRDAREAFERHRDRWQQAVTDAVDEGMKPADVGAVIGVSAQRVHAIVERIYRTEPV